MEDALLPSPAGTQMLVDVRGAEIVSSNSEDPEVYLPHHEEMISHIAVDIGGSLAKVVYFTRSPPQTTRPKLNGTASSASSPFEDSPQPSPLPTPGVPHPAQGRRTPSPPTPAVPNGILGPKSLSQQQRPLSLSPSSSSRGPAYAPFQTHLRRRSSTSRIPSGGRLNFVKFETSDLSSLISFLRTLISSSAASNRVPLDLMKRNVQIMATGGGAHKFHQQLRDELGIEVRSEEEMECLVLGLGFVMEIPNEVFWYSDELVQAISHPQQRALSAVNLPSTPGSSSTPLPIPPDADGFPYPTQLPPPPSELELPRPSPNPPQYSIKFDSNPTPAQFPCLLVNIGSGVSIIKIDDYGKFERISGTSLGGGTLWGLLSLLTGARSFDDMLALADRGDNSSVDMLVGDIYGQDYQKIGLKSSTIASSFGKVFRRGEGHGDGLSEDAEEERKKGFKPEDISRSLLYAISNNIGQIAYMNAEKHNLDRIYFGGGFIRGHAATISTLSYAIRFWSKGTKRALFLRHEGYLGGIGAWLKNIGGAGTPTDEDGQAVRSALSTSPPFALLPTDEAGGKQPEALALLAQLLQPSFLAGDEEKHSLYSALDAALPPSATAPTTSDATSTLLSFPWSHATAPADEKLELLDDGSVCVSLPLNLGAKPIVLVDISAVPYDVESVPVEVSEDGSIQPTTQVEKNARRLSDDGGKWWSFGWNSSGTPAKRKRERVQRAVLQKKFSKLGNEVEPVAAALSSLAAGLTLLSTNLPAFLAAMPGGALLKALLPLISTIVASLSWYWKTVKGKDKGEGVVLAATWVLPLAVVPRTLDRKRWPAEKALEEIDRRMAVESGLAEKAAEGGGTKARVEAKATRLKRVLSLTRKK
ncbi:hypothetical protein JCM10207_002218 [Rhodosporidiobolus poonsookiae]